MAENLNIISYNVKGLQQKNKRIKIYNYLQDKIGAGIILLQETHSTEKDAKKWEMEWKGREGKLLLNHGSSNSRGVAIGFTKNINCKVLKYEKDEKGRAQLLSFNHNEKLFLLINIYNHNTETEQVCMIRTVDNLLKKFSNLNDHNLIIGGDWNFILDKKLDATGGNPTLKLRSIAEFSKVKEKYNLCEIYRIRNPSKKRYTFRQKTPSLARRLDYFIISNTLQESVVKCDILTSLASDHSPFFMSIKTLNDSEKGSSYWKFNNTLVKNELYRKGLIDKINEIKIEYKDMDPQLKWELLKFEIRKFSIKFSKNLAKEKRKKSYTSREYCKRLRDRM